MTNETLIKEPPASVDLTTGEVIEVKEALEPAKEIIETHLVSQANIYSGSEVVEKAVADNAKINALVKEALTDKVHYGLIPGTSKKTLYQAGADVLARTFGLQIEYELIDKTIDIEANLIDYEYKAIVYWNGKKVGEAIASANTLEKKFAVKNGEHVFNKKNTIQQMSQKRAMVRAIRKVVGITEEFTQDLEDLQDIKASKDERLSIYGALYDLEELAPGKNKTERRNYLKMHVLKVICKEYASSTNMNLWTNEDVKVINEKLADTEYIAKLLQEAQNAK